MQLRPYQRLFPKKQILVSQAEAFWTRERESLFELYSFLGLSPPEQRPEQKARRNSLLFHVNRFLQRDSVQGRRGEAQIRLKEVLSTADLRKLTSADLARFLGFTSVDRERLARLYRRDVERLERIYPGISRGWDV